MDFITDRSGRHILRLSSLLTVPEFVKTSSVVAEDTVKLASHQFAKPSKREFPIDTAGHTYLSYAYCKSASVQDAELLTILKEAAAKFGIKAELEQIDAAFDVVEKQASTTQALPYAVYMDFGTGNQDAEHPLAQQGGTHGFYPIGTPDQLIKSASLLLKQRSDIPIELFVDGCRAVVKRASALGISLREIPTTVTSYGTPRLPNLEFLQQQADARVRLTGDDVYRDIVKSAAVRDLAHPWEDYLQLWKLADDQNAVKYSSSTWDPWKLFGSGATLEEQDQDLEKWAMVATTPVPVQAIAELNPVKVAKFLPKTVADKVLGVIKQASTLLGHELTTLVESELDLDAQKSVLRLLTQ